MGKLPPGVCRQPEPEQPKQLSPLSRDAILQANDLPVIEVDMEDIWGGSVHMITLSGAARDEWEQRIVQAQQAGDRIDIRGLKVDLLVRVLSDPSGKLLFGPKDGPALAAKSSQAIGRLFVRALRQNGLTAEAIEDIAGNSSSDLSVVSGTS